ncbi:hypothetical protein BDV37DRAFT_267048 [Aspergillus pseudonomiae]|uniref:F-box domain-containing protein n=1 Tax=Aspergillus pseudonomiae TaxID=1506151 RepID=A0A5N7CS49_9EURO|nr:uncharacterized protein BDV37DRAFT_267048 [Aspergillus pseudonomiae]KAE8396964.1 hypothetical protein BDV37DRAFT_267048 [Aspergillus pseudonomiae]
MLERLPPSVLKRIIAMLDQQEIRALSAVSRGLYDITAPVLFECLHIPIAPENALLLIKNFFQCHSRLGRARSLSLVRDLRFIVDVPERIGHRIASTPIRTDGCFPKSFGLAARLILEQLAPRKLTAFMWEFPWLPGEILGYSGYLPELQPQLTSITLSTISPNQREFKSLGLPCEQNVDGLLRLRYLKSLSWDGIHSERQIRILRRCLRQNSELEALHLSFSKEVRVDILQIIPAMDTKLFQSLCVLSLKNVFFSWSISIPPLLALPCLDTLALLDCVGTSSLSGYLLK